MTWKEVVVVYSRYYPRVCLEGLRNTTKNLSKNIQCLARDTKRALSEYERSSAVTCSQHTTHITHNNTTLKQNTAHTTTQTIKDTLHTMNTITTTTQLNKFILNISVLKSNSNEILNVINWSTHITPWPSLHSTSLHLRTLHILATDHFTSLHFTSLPLVYYFRNSFPKITWFLGESP
jgi:hypothetical protein